MKTKVTRENICRHLIEYQLGMAGKDIMVTLDDDKWWFNNTLTTEQHLEFKKYTIKLVKKTFRCNTAKALSTFEFFNNAFGLRIKN